MDLDILTGLLFGFPEFFGVRSKTRTNDFDFPPRLIPLKVGEMIKELDTVGRFHVITLDTHAEVWPKSQWLDSVSMRTATRQSAREHLLLRDKELTMEAELKRRLALTDQSLLATLMAAIREKSLNQQLIDALKLQDIVDKYHK